MEQHQISNDKRSRIRTEEPKSYNVILHNDDFTTMDFVVMLLETVFFKNAEDAEALMLAIHYKGKGVAGTYSYDIAQSKANRATRMAREANFPLLITVEPKY